MRRHVLHILAAFGAISLLFGCSKEGKVIPRSDMVNIYADMFLADGWLQDHHELSKSADTVLFYETVFRKYGYTTKDYIVSVNHYLKDPVRYSRMLKKTKENLDKIHRHLSDYSDALDTRNADEARIRSYDPHLIYYYNPDFIYRAEHSKLRMAPIDTFGRYWPKDMYIPDGKRDSPARKFVPSRKMAGENNEITIK